MSSRGYFRWWLIRDRCEGVEDALAGFLPVRPDARHIHPKRWLRVEVEHDVLFLLIRRQLASLEAVFWNVLVETSHHHDAMRTAEEVFPEILEARLSRVVQAVEFLVVEGWLASRPAVIAHR